MILLQHDTLWCVYFLLEMILLLWNWLMVFMTTASWLSENFPHRAKCCLTASPVTSPAGGSWTVSRHTDVFYESADAMLRFHYFHRWNGRPRHPAGGSHQCGGAFCLLPAWVVGQHRSEDHGVCWRGWSHIRLPGTEHNYAIHADIFSGLDLLFLCDCSWC